MHPTNFITEPFIESGSLVITNKPRPSGSCHYLKSPVSGRTEIWLARQGNVRSSLLRIFNLKIRRMTLVFNSLNVVVWRWNKNLSSHEEKLQSKIFSFSDTRDTQIPTLSLPKANICGLGDCITRQAAAPECQSPLCHNLSVQGIWGDIGLQFREEKFMESQPSVFVLSIISRL